jgi:hypothetical protein
MIDSFDSYGQPSVGIQVAPFAQKFVAELTSLLLYQSQRSWFNDDAPSNMEPFNDIKMKVTNKKGGTYEFQVVH